MNDKQKLIQQLQQSEYIALRPSSIHGIGVFALVDIPPGCRDIFGEEDGQWQKLGFEEVDLLPIHVRQLIENFCLFDETSYFVPSHGFKKMDLSLYLNHSDQPNVVSINDGEFFESTRTICAGEELFVDYGTICDSKE